MTRLIKRYGNRKLYDTRESRYVTLDDIASFVKEGEDVRVVDNDSSEDLTAVTFAQIILEEERKESGFLPAAILRGMIQQGEAALQGFATRVDKGIEAIGSVGHQAGRRVEGFVEKSTESGKAFLEDIRTSQQRQLEELQRQLDERLKKSTARLRSVPIAIQKELQRIEKSIYKLEESIKQFRSRDKSSDDDD